MEDNYLRFCGWFLLYNSREPSLALIIIIIITKDFDFTEKEYMSLASIALSATLCYEPQDLTKHVKTKEISGPRSPS